jgi:hypothetical protein
VPRFCKFTDSYPGKSCQSILRHWLRASLDIQPWDNAEDLEKELMGFQNAFICNATPYIADWKATCRYVFKALEVLLRYTAEYSWQESTRRWIEKIFRLNIYPRHGSKTLERLESLVTGNVFVPDSSLLNPLLQHKVNSLDFEGQHIYTLIPVLKLVNPPVKFLSAYDNDDNVEIPARPNAWSQDESATKLLIATKWFIAR